MKPEKHWCIGENCIVCISFARPAPDHPTLPAWLDEDSEGAGGDQAP